MAKYMLIKDSGQDCKYTLGRGMEITTLSSDNMDDAIQEALGLSDEHIAEFEKGEIDFQSFHDYYLIESLVGCYEEEYGPRAAQIFEVTDVLDLDSFIKEVKQKVKNVKNKIDAREREASELAKYKELKKRFEKNGS